MEIRITANLEVPELPPVVRVPDGARLRDVLSIIAPQVIDGETGDYKDDPDIWEIRLNGRPIYSLRDGLDTRMSEGDTLRLELILISGG